MRRRTSSSSTTAGRYRHRVPAGLLLTGGASRRLGFDKAELRLDGERLADRAARVLAAVCDPVLEVGPGRSALPAVADAEPGGGPLLALVSGADALAERGYEGPVLLLAVDLPFVTEALLTELAGHPADTVVPFVGAEPQTCCARYGAVAVETARRLAVEGERSLRALLDATPVTPLGLTGDRFPPHVLDDVDTPMGVERHGLEGPN